MKLKVFVFILVISLYLKSYAQDPIFTQYTLVPETLNPAFSGFENATYFGLLHRTQWPSLDLRVNTEYVFFNTWVESMNSGVGFSIMNQHENNTNYNHTQFNLNYAYIIGLDNDWYIRPALEIGIGMKSFNFQNLVLADQININSGTVSPTSIDPYALNDNRQIYFVDFTAGFVFDKRSYRNDTDFWAGASIKHINRPNISFFDEENVPLDIFYSIHASFKFPYFNDNKMLVSANYMQQSEYNRLDIGTTVKLNKLFLGATAVTNPAKNNTNSHLLTSINAFVGIELEKLRFGFSYDINTTDIGRTDGVYELSITYLARCLICQRPTITERRK